MISFNELTGINCHIAIMTYCGVNENVISVDNGGMD
jgi:hypothetical protein